MQSWYKPHPYSVFPKGNASPLQLSEPRFGSLAIGGDETVFFDVMHEILSYIDVQDTCRLSASCTAWYIFIHATDCWKRLYSLVFPKRLHFEVDWKTSVVRNLLRLNAEKLSGQKKKKLLQVADGFVHRPLAVKRAFFNDTLFQIWMCYLMPSDFKLTKIGLTHTTSTQPVIERCSEEGGAGDDEAGRKTRDFDPAGDINQRFEYRSKLKVIPRICGNSITPEEFQEKFEAPGIPVILTDVATHWPMFKILNTNFQNFNKPELFRSREMLQQPMRCEHTTMSTEEYLDYANAQKDERPIYMFDAEFAKVFKTEELFDVPLHFAKDDYFRVLGDERPKYRWLIAGPRRGGSMFHVDPNFTHAWNACLTGRKRWLFFPPNCPPPGVYPSSDMSDVTCPVSLTEWLMNFYSASVTSLRHVGYEGICETGEIMFVPAGWWHFVINLEDSVAITQNYVSRTNLTRVIHFVRTMKGSISGINEDADDAVAEAISRRRDNFADQFVARMREYHPKVMKEVDDEINEATERRRKRPREKKVEMLETSSEGFSFTF